MTWVALVGTKIHAQCLEKPGSSAPGRPCLGLTLNFPTLTEFPDTFLEETMRSGAVSQVTLSPGAVRDKLHC